MHRTQARTPFESGLEVVLNPPFYHPSPMTNARAGAGSDNSTVMEIIDDLTTPAPAIPRRRYRAAPASVSAAAAELTGTGVKSDYQTSRIPSDICGNRASRTQPPIFD